MEVKSCRICGNTDLEKFLSLGSTPLANNFLKESDVSKEESFPLELLFCYKCKLVQLNYVVPPEKMFRDYVYVPSASETFKQHFREMANELIEMGGLNEKSLAVDIGSNDGLMLGYMKEKGVNVMGVDPATNLMPLARARGVDTINDFFGTRVVQTIKMKHGKADVISASNVFAHINNIKEVVSNVKELIKDDGMFVIEAPYLVDMFDKMTFDLIYHEHLSYFSAMSLKYFFENQGLHLFKIKRIPIHGGSLRIFVQKKGGKYKEDGSVQDLLDLEAGMGLDTMKAYKDFAQRVEAVKTKMLDFVGKIKTDGKTIAGYGAPAKATTLLCFCGIGDHEIDYIVDDNPLKQNLLSPGTHIPVVKSTTLDERKPDYILILAWNVADEIIKKNQRFADMGVKFIVPLPEPKIV